MMTRSNSSPFASFSGTTTIPVIRQAVALAEDNDALPRIGITCGRGATKVAPYGGLAAPCGDAVQRLREAFGVVLPGDDHRR